MAAGGFKMASALFRASRLTTARTLARNLHLHEAYSLDLLKKAGVIVPRCEIANTADEAAAAVKKIGATLKHQNGTSDL